MDSPRTPGSFLPLPDAELEILIALADGEAHGYAIMRAVAERTEGRRRLGPGTLYTALELAIGGGAVLLGLWAARRGYPSMFRLGAVCTGLGTVAAARRITQPRG